MVMLLSTIVLLKGEVLTISGMLSEMYECAYHQPGRTFLLGDYSCWWSEVLSSTVTD